MESMSLIILLTLVFVWAALMKSKGCIKEKQTNKIKKGQGRRYDVLEIAYTNIICDPLKYV